MQNCKNKCSFYFIAYFISIIAGTAAGLLFGFGIIPFLTTAITGVIAFAALTLITLLFNGLNDNCDSCPFGTPKCVLKHLAVQAALTVIFGLLTLTFGGVLVADAIFLGLTVAAFVATIVSVVATAFLNDEK